MRRLSLILGGLAFFWACAVTWYVLQASSEPGMMVSAVAAGIAGDAHSVAPPLASAKGVWVTGLLVVISVLSGVPMGVALTHPPVQRVTAWTTGSVLLVFCLLAGLSLGLPYLPSALLVFGVAVIANEEPRLRFLRPRV
ncbi:MAG: hypothetical protein WEA34_03500 [Gemmatimonadota bacterium]